MKTWILPIALCASVLAFSAAPSFAADQTEHVSATVSLSDLNLSTREGATAMRHRIRSAARALCGEQPDIGEPAFADWRSCINDATRKAVARVDARMVIAQSR
jgi:UrcA family protein